MFAFHTENTTTVMSVQLNCIGTVSAVIYVAKVHKCHLHLYALCSFAPSGWTLKCILLYCCLICVMTIKLKMKSLHIQHVHSLFW